MDESENISIEFAPRPSGDQSTVKSLIRAGDRNDGNIVRNIIESYVMAEARYDVSIYAERLLIRLVEAAQKYIYGLVDFIGALSSEKIEIGEWGDAEINLPLRSILSGKDDRNYDKAKAAVEELMSKFLSYDDGETYKATQILNDVEMKREKGRLIVRVNRNIWRAMLDFSRGYRLIDVETVMHLRSRYAVRLYSLVCKSTDPLTFTISQLREMWGLQDRYPVVAEFLRNTVDKAKEELDRKSQYSFRYTTNCARSAPENRGRTGKLKVTSITFYPERRYVYASQTTDNLRKQIAPSLILGKETVDLLKHKFNFVDAGIRNNIKIFEAAHKNMDLFDFLEKIAPVALRTKNPQGYVVGALRRRLVEDVGIPEEEIA